MQELEATWERVVSVWWLLAWRGVVGGVVLGAVIGFVIGVVAGLAGFSPEQIRPVASVAGAIIGFGWALVVVRMMLAKHYKDFRIALVPIAAP